ncbi:MAG TPA: UvrD-helicase domain-containing protein [Clostridiaceae bacterium]|nr:UvrD-helicase domain-containing protein [Clostridiaceae bacterium]
MSKSEIQPENLTESELENLFTDDLNPVQKEAVLHKNGPLLILAGAGSGKTRVITYRIAYLVKCCGVWPSEILAITFTNKAANEMKERVEQLLGFNSRGIWIGTFHSMMLRILRQHADRIGFEANFTILDSDDQQRLIKEILKELNLDTELFNVRTVQNKISSAKNQMQTWQEFERESGYDNLHKQIAEIYKRYQAVLKRGNSMDFDDILVFAVEMLQQNPDILDAYQTRFKHILVDEYQDTNHVQYLLVKLLSGKYKNICVVGDDDQSIYSFRGANIENILNFEKDFKYSKVIKLEQNYRSTQTILAAANSVIKQNTSRKAKRLWTEKNEGDPINFYLAENQYEEARYVATEIKRLTERNRDPIPAGNIGILYRVNALSRNLEFALREQGINYSIYGGLRFYDRKEIRDFLAYLRVVFSDNDELAIARIINVPRRGIGDLTIERSRNIARRENISLMQVLVDVDRFPELSRTANSIKQFVQIIAELRTIMLDNQISFPEFAQIIQEKSGLLQELIEQKESGQEQAISRIENLQEILSDTIEFTDRMKQEIEQFRLLDENYDQAEVPELAQDEPDIYQKDLSLSALTEGFLEQTALFSDLDQDTAENTVRLMAIHSAKGLEFDAVFLIGMEESIFPGYRSFEAPEQLEEERRLAYVGITRARRYLHMTAARYRLLYGQTKYNPVSRFMSEIPNEYIREIGGSRQNNFESNSGKSIPDKSRYSDHSPGVKSKILGSFGLRDKQRANSGKNSRLNLMDFSVGQSFTHKKFGTGIIKKIDYVASDAILTMNFNGQIKRLMASTAQLEKIDD